MSPCTLFSFPAGAAFPAHRHVDADVLCGFYRRTEDTFSEGYALLLELAMRHGMSSGHVLRNAIKQRCTQHYKYLAKQR